MTVFEPADSIKRLPEQYFTELRKQANAVLEAQPDAIDLAVGTPDLSPPEELLTALKEAADNTAYDKYGPYRGEDFLKEAVANYYQREFNVDIDPQTEVAVFHGSKEAITKVSQALINPGEGILMPNPTYPDYLSAAAFTDAELIEMDLLIENDFFPDYSKIEQQDREKAKVMYLNYPNNPTTALATPEFFEETVDFASENNICVVHDLAYGPYVFDDQKPLSFLQTKNAKNTGVELFSLSKIYNISGWRVGFAVGNPSVIEYLNILQDHMTVGMYGAIQEATAELLNSEQKFTEEMRQVYERRRDVFLEEFEKENIAIDSSKGTIFIWLQAPNGLSSQEFFERLHKEANVIVAPGDGFGKAGEGFVRIGLVKPEEEIREGARRIVQFFKKHT